MITNRLIAILACAVLCSIIVAFPDYQRLNQPRWKPQPEKPLTTSWGRTSKWDELHVEWTLVDTKAERERTNFPDETMILVRAKITNPTVYNISLHSLTLNLAVDDLPLGEPTEFVPYSLVNGTGSFIDAKTSWEGIREIWIPSSTVETVSYGDVIARASYKVHR